MDFSYDIKLEALEELPPSLGGRSISLLSWWRETSFRFAVRTVCRDGNRHIVSTPSTWLEMLLRAYPPQGRKFPCYWLGMLPRPPPTPNRTRRLPFGT